MNAVRAAHGLALDRGAILVVDDDVLVRLDLAQELRSAGHTVIEAANGAEALSILRSSLRVDLVLTDIRMPGPPDGLALARLVRAEYPFIRIVLTTADPPDAATRQAMDGCFAKPYDLAKLVACSTALLAKGN